MKTYTAILWIGEYGSWSKDGFATYAQAAQAANDEIASGRWGTRTDLVPYVEHG